MFVKMQILRPYLIEVLQQAWLRWGPGICILTTSVSDTGSLLLSDWEPRIFLENPSL